MEANFLNCFINAAVEILKQELKTTIKRGELIVDATEFTSDELNVILSIKGSLNGKVIISCSKDMAQKSLKSISKKQIPEESSLINDGFSELANIIIGRASMQLEQSGYPIDLVPPVLIEGKNLRLWGCAINTINVPLILPEGVLMLKLGLSHTK
jgi:chemotaxis protein CheX